VGKQLSGVLHKYLTRRRERNTVRIAVHQLDRQRFLEHFDALGGGRRGEKAPLGTTPHAAGVCNVDEQL
jgi:hypothetical protein